MKFIRECSPLQQVTKTGKKKYWKITVFETDGVYYYQKTWWQEGSKVQTSTPVEVEGKNIGRSNETTPHDQALSEADSLIQQQRDKKGYRYEGEEYTGPTLPMTANTFKKKAHKITYPCFVQPKLDGHRMIMSGDHATTRGGKNHVQECIEHLLWDTEYEIDGEIMLPDNLILQASSSAIKKFRPELSPQLMFMAYDVVMEGEGFAGRSEWLKHESRNFPPNVKFVQTELVHNEEEVQEWHDHWVALGYEGCMVRNMDGQYLVGKRSNDLLKVKMFQDAEFEIVRIDEGKGSFKGKAIIVCVTEKGDEFACVPEGTAEYRTQLYDDREKHIGKMFTVRFQTYSSDGIPTGNTVGVDFRDKGEF